MLALQYDCCASVRHKDGTGGWIESLPWPAASQSPKGGAADVLASGVMGTATFSGSFGCLW